MNWATKAVSALIPLAVLLTACAPTSGPRQGAGGSAEPQKPKVLTMGVLTKVATIDGYTGEGGTRGGAGMLPLLNDVLTRPDPQGVVQPQLATEVPSVERGTWQILPDGRMVMTWKLRQGVKWQDGAPFTSDDLVFAYTLRTDTELAHATAATAKLMESAANPDPHTLIVTWKSVYVQADEETPLPPQPRHLLEDLYRSDKQAFLNSPYFRHEFVGTGAYRMTSWEGGVQMDLARFDDYWKGRPPLDRIILRIISDTNTSVAQILAGAVDVIMTTAVTPEATMEVRRRWEGTGHVTRIEPVDVLDYIEPMMRLEYARPVNGMPQLGVRHAMMHGIDRASLAEAITVGLGFVADSHWFPDDALTPHLDSAIVKYPYDPTRARQLLSQAGWEPGPDGTLVHRPSGERFETEILVNERLAAKVGAIIADDWKKLGIVAVNNPIPPARSTDRQYQGQRPGPYATYSFGDWSSDRLYGKDIASDANRWAGRNRAGWINPRSDTVLELLKQTIDPAQRLPLLREQVQFYTGEAALMPLFWEVRTILALKTVQADIRPASEWWNPFAWDKEAS